MITDKTPVWVPDRRPHTAAHRPHRSLVGGVIEMGCGYRPAQKGRVITRDEAAQLCCHPCVACFQLPMPVVRAR